MRAVVIPVDSRIPMAEVEGSHIRHIVDSHTNLGFFEVLTTPLMKNNNFVMLVSAFPGQGFNRRAALLTGRDAPAPRTDVILIGVEARDFVDVREDILHLLTQWGVEEQGRKPIAA